jgi:hypothetical protein
MIRRSITLFAVAASSLLFVGCAAPSEGEEEIVGEANSALPGDCVNVDSDSCDPTAGTTNSPIAFTFQLNVDSSGNYFLTGVNGKGQTLDATRARFASTTVFRAANLNTIPTDPIIPTDPLSPTYRDVASSYNTAYSLGDGSVFNTLTTASQYFKARVWLNRRTNTVRAFRLVY